MSDAEIEVREASVVSEGRSSEESRRAVRRRDDRDTMSVEVTNVCGEMGGRFGGGTIGIQCRVEVRNVCGEFKECREERERSSV